MSASRSPASKRNGSEKPLLRTVVGGISASDATSIQRPGTTLRKHVCCRLAIVSFGSRKAALACPIGDHHARLGNSGLVHSIWFSHKQPQRMQRVEQACLGIEPVVVDNLRAVHRISKQPRTPWRRSIGPEQNVADPCPQHQAKNSRNFVKNVCALERPRPLNRHRGKRPLSWRARRVRLGAVQDCHRSSPEGTA